MITGSLRGQAISGRFRTKPMITGWLAGLA